MKLNISGQGKSVVFIHGYCESLDIWRPFEKALSAHYQVISVDLPGHGGSVLSKSNFSIDEIAEEVFDALESKDITSFFVIGHSLGGYVSLALKELYSNNVKGFGLFSSTTHADDEDKKKARDKVKEFLEQHGVDTFIDSFVPILFTPANQKKFFNDIENLKRIGKQMQPEAIYGYAQAMKHRPDRTHLLTDPQHPVFIIAGDRDMAVRIDTSKKLMDLIALGDACILKDAGHQGFIESEEESIEFIRKFLLTYYA